MATIGLIDVDSHNYPNLSLMKLSAYHKNKGDTVEFWNGFEQYDIVYKSKVFTDLYSKDHTTIINADQIIQGGTGYNLTNQLPKEVETQYPDYQLYGNRYKNTAYGFLTRGCPNNCSFCIVTKKEGQKSIKVSELNQFWKKQKKIVLMDPNITANEECENLFQDLINSKASIDINQGLDIRYMTDKKVHLLNQMKIEMIHFAWDNYEFNTYQNLKYFRPKLKFKGRKLGVYVLTNYNTTKEQDLERIYKLRELDYDPYVMIYDKPNSSKEKKEIQRWVNRKSIWRTNQTIEEYKSFNTRMKYGINTEERQITLYRHTP